ncbi:hypothetical protein ACP4OV_021020 [Aristida adscensionis]
MPNTPYLYAGDFIKVLQNKHASHSYSKMVIYVEACESGSIFEGLLPEDFKIYVTTASNAIESSYATYCPWMTPPPPPEYTVFSETHNRMIETLKDQYEAVKLRTSQSSHVMEYGDKTFRSDKLFLYQGFTRQNANIANKLLFPEPKTTVDQRDADLLFLWNKYEQLNEESEEKFRIVRKIKEIVDQRKHVENNIDFIGRIVFGFEKGPLMLKAVRNSGQSIVDSWDCLKKMLGAVQIFESQCGSLTQYDMKYMRALANMCNNGVSESKMMEASIGACNNYNSARRSPVTQGHSAA